MNLLNQRPGSYSKYYYLLMVFFLTAACSRDNTGNKDTQIDDELDQEKTFAVEASYSNLAEIRMGEMAQTRSGSESVIEFAQTMVNEHTTALQNLKEIADEHEIELPDTLKMQHRQIQDELSNMKGAAFDSAYMNQQIQAHQQAQQLFQTAINEDTHPDFLNYARTTLEHINSHLARAQEIVGSVGSMSSDENSNDLSFEENSNNQE